MTCNLAFTAYSIQCSFTSKQIQVMKQQTLLVNFTAAFLLIAITMGGAVMIAVARHDIAVSFGAPEWLVSLLYAIFFFLAGIAAIPFDTWIRKWGYRKALTCAGISTLIGGIVCYQSTDFL